MPDFDPETMRARFHELGRQRDAIIAVSGPLREQRDAMMAEHRLAEKELADQIKTAEADLGSIDEERAFLARGLGGKTGEAT